LLITNRPALPARQVIQTYARRMNIEQRPAEAIQSFSLDALAGPVPLNVDLDVALSMLARTTCTALRRRLPGYGTATPDTLQRRFLNTGGTLNRGPRSWSASTGAPTHPSCARPASPNHHRARVGRPHAPLRVRLTQLGVNSLSENRR
jgi:hypothetical protein